ncbi:hypothetical protein JOE37_001889 [Clavibacter michiganensis]|nr:hypothetical protein [Clavibacter michiganensis]
MLTVALGLLSWTLYVLYDNTLPTFGEPPPTGSIHLYFDQPNVVAELSVQVTSELATGGDGLATDSYAITVLAEGIKQANPPRFYLSLGGSALPHGDGPTASDMRETSGCSWAVVSQAPELACDRTKGSPDSAWVVDERKEDIVVVSGLLKPLNDKGQGLANVGLSTEAASLVGAGETEVFQLPTIGTTDIPATVGEEFEIMIDDFGAVQVPGPLTIVVRYQYLAPTDQLDSLSIEPRYRQPLTWVETYMSTLTASGTITDTTEARSADRSTFFWGVLAGVCGGFFVSLIAFWSSIIAAWRSWRRHEHAQCRAPAEADT